MGGAFIHSSFCIVACFARERQFAALCWWVSSQRSIQVLISM